MKSHRNINPKSIQAFILILVSSIAVYILSQTTFPSHQILQNLHNNRRLYSTNTTRLPIVSTYCTESSISISSSDYSTNSMYQSSLGSYMKANATRLVIDLVNSNLGDLMTEIQINGTGTIIFISPFIIGLALLLLATPCLICCCTCQQSCPPQCCRNKNPNYSHTDVAIPTVIVVLLCLLIICTSIVAMTSSKPFFADFNCQTAKFIDDFYNGNQTQDQQYFFSGVSYIRYQLSQVLSPAMSSVNTQVSRLQATPSTTTMATLITDINTVLTNLKSIPRGSDYLQFTQSYSYPLESSSSTATFTSVLGPSIGTYGVSSTILGGLYTSITAILSSMQSIASASSNVAPHLTAGDMGAQITAADAILGSVQNNLDSLNSQLQTVMSLLSKIDSYNIAYSIIFYGVLLGLSFLILIAIIFMKCLSMQSCRHFIYLICILMFFLAILLFLYAIILSFLTPSIYYTCKYFQNTFTSPTAYTSMISTLLGSGYSNMASQFAQCFGGTNDFITTVNPTLSGYISELKSSVFDSYKYQFTTVTTNINSQVSKFQTTINDIGLGHLPDFDITTANGQLQISKFNQIANKSIFNTNCPSGSFNIFYQDVWVPGLSTTYQASVDCLGKVSIDNTTCGSNIANTASCPYSRCIDTFSIIGAYYRGSKSAGVLSTDANTRYGTCADFNSYLTNYYNNYVKPVIDSIGNTVDDSADLTKLAGRFATKGKAPITTVINEMNGPVKTLFTQVYNNLTQTSGLQSIFDPSTGVLTGLDCRLLSQNGVNAKNSLCVTSLNRIYLTLVTVGILAFAFFFSLCCIVCFNVRNHQKSREKGGNHGRVYPIALDETSSEIQIK